MTVFLTGASGYLGSVVLEKLVDAGYPVRALIRRKDSETRPVSQRQGVEIIMGDLLDIAAIAREAAKADAVIHAGFAHQADFTSALEHDRRLALGMIAALKGSGKPFIFSSGGMITVDQAVGERSEQLVTEEMDVLKTCPSFIRPRALAERDVETGAQIGVRTIVMRLGSVYGRGGSHFIPMMIEAAKKSGFVTYIGRGLNVWPHVHVEDVADAYILALRKAPAGSLFNVADKEFDMVTLARLIAKAMDLEQPQSLSLEAAHRTWGPFADPLAANGRFSSRKIHEVLGWKPQGPSVEEELLRGSYRSMIEGRKPAGYRPH